jgi:hypothetical protein
MGRARKFAAAHMPTARGSSFSVNSTVVVDSYEDFRYAGTAAEALAKLDGVYAQWIAGVRGLDTAGLSRPCGPSEVQYGNPSDLPLVSLVLHISREVIHHGAEIALLRDLYTPGHQIAR